MRLRVYDTHEQVPYLGRHDVERILIDVALPQWMVTAPLELRPTEARIREFRGLASDDLTAMLGGTDRSPLAAISNVVRTPRRLRSLIGRVHQAWQELSGEIDLLDLLAIETIYLFLPAPFEFVQQRYRQLANQNSDLPMYDGDSRRPGSDHHRRQYELFNECCTGPDAEHAWQLIGFLFPYPNSPLAASSPLPSRQGLRTSSPTCYFERWQRREVNHSEVSDKRVIQLIMDFNDQVENGTSGPVALVRECFDNPHIAKKTEQFENLLAQPYALASRYLQYAASSPNAVSSHVVWNGLEGSASLWRMCLGRPESRPDGWLSSTFKSLSVHSLRLAASVVSYWQHTSRATIDNSGRIIESEWVDVWRSFEETFRGNPTRLLEALDGTFPWTVAHIVTGERQRTIGNDNLLWVGELMLECVRLNPRAAMPQLVHLLTNTDSNPITNTVSAEVDGSWLNHIFGNELDRLSSVVDEGDIDTDLDETHQSFYRAALDALKVYLLSPRADSGDRDRTE